MDIKAFLSKVGFDKHHRFERFGVIFSSLVLVLAIITSVAFVGKLQMDNKNLTNKVVYTTKFKTSLTNIEGSVNNIYRSRDNTKVFIVLNISDMSSISVNAKNYQMFLTGCKTVGDTVEGAVLEHPTVNGSIYMFGSTGYMGIYLVDNKSFPSQIYDLVIRCNSRIVSSASSLDTDENGNNEGNSFTKYDQFRIYFNPGGAECDTADFLDKDNWNIIDAYEECVSRKQEKELRDILAKDIETLQLNLSAIDEYIERLKNLNVVVPDASPLIAGDEVIEEDDHLVFKPKHVLATGFDFDWYNGSIKDGYLDALCGDLTYTQYLNKKRAEVEGSQLNLGSIEWVMTDGTKVNDLDTSVANNKTIVDTTGLLSDTWNTYYSNKQKYECTDLKSLLNLELDTRNVESDYTINSDKDTALIVF